MKLIVAIIDDQYINEIAKTLMENKLRMTKLASTGGFLKAGNTTLLIGTEEKDMDNTIALIRGICEVKEGKRRTKNANIAGANLFILDVEQHMRV